MPDLRFGRDHDPAVRWALPSDSQRDTTWRRWLRAPLPGSTPTERRDWRQAVVRADVVAHNRRASQGDTTV